MSKEQVDLMKPQYMVNLDYPKSEYVVGQVIDYNNFSGSITSKTFCEIYDKYPVIFRKMKWFEGKDIEDLPRYVSVHPDSECCLNKTIIYEVYKWNKWNDSFHRYKHYAKVIGFEEHDFSISHFLPATEQEYLDYSSKK
jgi:hypothetical protein